MSSAARLNLMTLASNMKLATASLWLLIKIFTVSHRSLTKMHVGVALEPPNLMLFSDTTRAFKVTQQMTWHIGTA